jgi:hypothetical protein
MKNAAYLYNATITNTSSHEGKLSQIITCIKFLASLSVVVVVGTLVRFRVNQNSENSNDLTALSVFITYVDPSTKETWNYTVPGAASAITLSPSTWVAYSSNAS